MERLKHDQYLPCHFKQIIGHNKKKSLPDGDSKPNITSDIEIMAMNKGYRFTNKQDEYFINDVSLLKKIDNRSTLNEIIKNENDIEVIERLFFYDVINFDNKKSFFFKEFDAPKYRNLYDGNESWFFMVPSKIELDITSQCNFQCIHCSREAENKIKKGELTTNEIKGIIKNASEIGVNDMTFMGGEPTVNKDFLELSRYCSERGISPSMSTNGWLVDRKMAGEVAKYFKNIQVSIHGATAETHDKIVKKEGAFERAKNAVRYMKEAGIGYINISFSVMEQNYKEIKDMPAFVESLGADALRYLKLNPQGRGKCLNQWTQDDIGDLSKIFKDIYDKTKNIKINVGGFASLKPIDNDCSFYGCPAGRTMLYIASNGDSSCCGVVDDYIGNIKEKSILELWHDKKMVDLRKTPDCECNYKPICGGRCRADL